MNKTREYIRLLRLPHWIKNLLVFVPLFFNTGIFNRSALAASGAAFVSFCLLSSIIYIQNDLRDIEKDRKHSVKCRRPLASGALPIRRAYAVCGLLSVLLAAALAGLFLLHHESRTNIFRAAALLVVYTALNTGYSLGLKNIPIVDVTILAAGYVIRLLFGAAACGVEVSVWLYLVITMGAYYMGLGKRRNEILSGEKETRTVMRYYSHSFLDKNMYISQALCIVFYAMWSIDPITVKNLNTSAFVYTIPLIFIILLKYSYNVETGTDGDPAPVLLHDKTLIVLCGIYLACAFCIIYLRKGL
jgi:4-hydroxybenzoate polyprenyltransferase